MNAFKILSVALLMACAPYAANAQDAGLSKQQ